MSTIHIDNEDTVYENNERTYSQNPDADGNIMSHTESTVMPEQPKEMKHKNTGRIIASVGAGVLIGGVSSFLMSMAENKPGGIGSHGKDNLTHPEWVDGEIDIATSVNDNMTFDEAFATARAEVGPGGAFEWRGQIYGTYSMTEWNQMSAAEKAEFGSHFSWNHIDNTNSVVGNHISDNTIHNTDIHQPIISDEQIEHELDQQIAASVMPESDDEPYLAHSVDGTAGSFDQNIEILGVSFDNDANAPIGKMTIDGQEVILVDIDNDRQFDYMAVDVDNNGVIDTEEITPIHDEHMSVDDLVGLSDDFLSMRAGNGEPDDSMAHNDINNLCPDMTDCNPNPMTDMGDFNNFSPHPDEFDDLISNS